MDGPPCRRLSVAREVHLELRVPVATVLEAQRLKLVIAFSQPHVGHLQVPPQVAGRVTSAVDADEGAEAVVSVHAEVVGAREVAVERDDNICRSEPSQVGASKKVRRGDLRKPIWVVDAP